jgi:hypothetical protein
MLSIELVRPNPASRQRVIEIKTGNESPRTALRTVEGGFKAKAT